MAQPLRLGSQPKINADGSLIHLLSTHLHKAESCLNDSESQCLLLKPGRWGCLSPFPCLEFPTTVLTIAPMSDILHYL